MANVFLSYARGDMERVRPLAIALESDGHSVWWDSHISGGAEFAGAIEEALASANVVVVCWSETSVRSAWVRDEAAAGRNGGRLLPVSLDGCLPPLGFGQYHTIDLSDWNGRTRSRALDPLKAAIREKASTALPGEVAPTPQRMRPKRWFEIPSWALAAGAALLLLASGALLYTRVWAGGGLSPEVAVGRFALASAGLPPRLPDMIGQEVVAAFGAENAVTVVAPGTASAAPFVMEGNISQLGETVRIAINLLNRKSGVVLWSNAYEHEAADAIAARQAAVGASQVVRCGLWGAANYKDRMPDQALSLYLKWCNEHWSGSPTGAAELDAARRVTVAIPDFSFGWSALALATVQFAEGDTSDAKRLREEGMAAAHKSMELDAHNPEGYMAIAWLLPLERYKEREELLTKAISVRPTECGCERQAYGDFLSSVGRMTEAVDQYERARAMRPLAPFSNLRFAHALYMVGRNDEADRVLGDTLKLWPDATSLRLLKIKSALWTGRYDEAIDLLKDSDLPLTSTQRATLAAAFSALKTRSPPQQAAAVAGLESFALDARYNDRLVVGMLAALGAREAALQAAANLMRTRGRLDAEVLFEPHLAATRNALGYAELVRGLGLADYWRAARSAPDICRGSARPRFCVMT